MAVAKNVVGTNFNVDDYSAFRFSSYFYQCVTEKGLSYNEAYRSSCLAAIRDDLPTYLEEIKAAGDPDLLVSAIYFSKENRVFWEPYTLWNNYE